MPFPPWKKNRILRDPFRSGFGRRALLCGLDRPFRKGVHLKHNNLTEALEMARVLHELGYAVDVINHDNPRAVDYASYEVLFGAGLAMEQAILQERFPRLRTILYMCGAYVPWSNRASLARLDDLHRRRGVWLPGSARLGDPGWGLERVVDGLIVLGNAVVAAPYRAVTPRPVHELPLFFLRVVDPEPVLAARDLSRARRHFVWFAGTGLVHKGLDLALEAFARHPDLHLHVYGAIQKEPAFLTAFQRELRGTPNVHVEGFLGLDGPAFRPALLASAFVVSPSCAEAILFLGAEHLWQRWPRPHHHPGMRHRPGGFRRPRRGHHRGGGGVGPGPGRRPERRRTGPPPGATAAYMAREHSLERYRQRLKDAVQAILSQPAELSY